MDSNEFFNIEYEENFSFEIKNKINDWDNDDYLKIEYSNCYPEVFIDELYNLWSATKEYLSDKQKTLKEISIEQGISSNKIKLFSKYFVKTRKLVPSYFAYNGYSGKMGLAYAIAQARIYVEINNKIPTAREFRKYRSGILHAINSGYWEKLGVKKGSYNDFLKLAFDSYNQKYSGYYTGYPGLMSAKKEISQFEPANGKIPTYNEVHNNFGGIINAINQGYWEDYGINKGDFNAFLQFVFGSVNQYQKEKGVYKGEEGLKLAVSEVKELKSQMMKLPTLRDVESNHRGIIYAIKNGYWVEFGIRKGRWNDFLKYVFGKTNKKEQGYYRGKTGLERALKEARELISEIGRIPTYKELYKASGGIFTAIRQAYWQDFGISKYSDFKELIGQDGET